jgi:hypothetical protein
MMRAPLAALVAGLAVVVCVPAHAADPIKIGSKMTADKPPELLLEIDAPTTGAVIGDPMGSAFVCAAMFGEYQTFDIVLVVDTSEHRRASARTSTATV